MKRAPARESDLNRPKNPNHGGALDLGSSYGDEVADYDEPSSTEKARKVNGEEEEYGSSEDDLEDEALLEEGELNEA